jgi:hydroxymethylpyrimidine pyrophosphatase-like HAD family hydrolase
MRYMALATDYDQTLATDGQVAPSTLAALEALKASGRKILLATGRHLDDLRRIFPKIDVFDRIVAENGAVLCDPASREETLLTENPPLEFLSALRQAGVKFDAGRVIISSWTPAEIAILDVIKKMALDYQVIFNKGAVMVLPSGVNKATGVTKGLESLLLSPHNTVSIGDAENDHSLLAIGECGVAVANAVPSLLDRADVVTKWARGEGVVELINEMLEDDLRRYDDRLNRSTITVGVELGAERSVNLIPNRNCVLVAGASASGKSSAVAGILEEFAEKGYQFCVIDPEGDFENFVGALPIGSPSDPPDPIVIAKALESPQNLVVNLMNVPMSERPAAFSALLPKILEMRSRTSRPHCLVIDEAHHLLPPSWSPVSDTIPQQLSGSILITVHPERVSPTALALVDTVLATGSEAAEILSTFAQITQILLPQGFPHSPQPGQALLWFARGNSSAPTLVTSRVAKAERRRHRRNYAEGELSPEQSFYFRGPENKLNLRAQNLATFLQIADGVDDETWLFHSRRGDYSSWFENTIKDVDLADAARQIEQAPDATQVRAAMREIVVKRYTM